MIIICGDKETIQNRDFGFDHEARKDAAESIEYSDLAELVPDGVEFEVAGDFRDWNGGKYSDQARTYGYRQYGLVCYESDSEKDAAEKISDALDRLIEGRCRQIVESFRE